MIIRALLAGLVLLSSAATAASAGDWHSDFHPYRLRLKLAQPAQGKVSLELDPADVIRVLQPIALEDLRLVTFAFDKAVLIDPASGQKVGGFELIGEAAMAIDGSFTQLEKGEQSPWSGFIAAEMKFQAVNADGESFRALMIEKKAVANTKLAQPLKLIQGQFYLLDWRVWSDAEDNSIDVTLHDPARWYFAQLPGSYTPALSPRGKWTRFRSLKFAKTEAVELRIGTAFIGSCGVADIGLTPVKWKVIADLPSLTDELDLYCVALGGHLIASAPEKIRSGASIREVEVKEIHPEVANLNPKGVLIEGEAVRAWSIPASLPLDPDRILLTVPRAASTDAPVRVNVLPGGSATAVIAVQSRTPLLRVLNATCDLPVPAQFERIAEVPLFDGPYPNAVRIGARFDARMPLDSELIPPSQSGVHPICVTFAAAEGLAAGIHRGVLRLRVRTQVPREEDIAIPIELRVMPLTLKPMHHSTGIIASPHLDSRFSDENYLWPGATPGEFHGMKQATQSLIEKYRTALIQHGLVPQHLASKNDTCEVIDHGSDKAPELRNWNFDGLDYAIDHFVLKHDLPWLMIFHSNGDVMHALRLPNGETYTFRPVEGLVNHRQLSREAYFELVAAYFDAMAQHLEKRGVLDRAVYLIDESSHESFPVIYEYTRAVRSRQFGARIKFAHTTYKTSTFTQRLPDGSLIMDQALDMPMPDNDEEFNFFEPEYNARFAARPKRNWVYYVESTHFTLDYAGLSTMITPLKLGNFGAEGWFCWAALVWNCPWKYDDQEGPRWKIGPVVNPWLNTFYHHGPGALALFYPPDPRGLALEPTEQIIPSYRLSLMRDGFVARAMLEALRKGQDDAGQPLHVNVQRLAAAEAGLQSLYTSNPTQWYLSYPSCDAAIDALFDAVESH